MMALASMILLGKACGSETGVLMQSQAEYSHGILFAAEGAGAGKAKGAAVVMRESAARVNRIQDSAQKMADAYGAIVQKIVDAHSLVDPKTGTPYTPDEGLMNTLNVTFASLEDQLDKEKDTNQELINGAWNRTEQCLTQRQTAYEADPGGVIVRKTAADTARTNHNGCRDAEIEHENTNRTECESFHSLASQCQSDYGYFTKAITTAGFDDGSLSDLIVRAGKCETAHDALVSKASTCDGSQKTFEEAFCKYANKLQSVCNTYESCYTDAVNDWGTVKRSIKELETSQKTVLKMLRKVQCYIKLLMEATPTDMPTQTQIDTCKNLGTDADPIDTSQLSIQYDDLTPKDVCDTSSIHHKPNNTEIFHNTEYSNATLHEGRVEDSITMEKCVELEH